MQAHPNAIAPVPPRPAAPRRPVSAPRVGASSAAGGPRRTLGRAPGPRPGRTWHRTVWISDVHLGTRSAKAAFLLSFLRSVETDHLYLVGDILDLWKLGFAWYWSAPQDDVVQEVVDLARRGTRVTFVPGNHDEWFRRFDGLEIAGVDIRKEAVHELACGRRLLVLHGDRFDAIVLKCRWLARLGGHAYDLLIACNTAFNWMRKRLGMQYWSLSAYLKHKAKGATAVMRDFEETVAGFAAGRGFDGVVCGHIHRAVVRDVEGVLYCNSGDWVESCTALVESASGAVRIVAWPTAAPVATPSAPPAAVPAAAPAAVVARQC